MNMKDYIQNILEVVDQFRRLGKIIPEDNIVVLLLCSLPESYDSLITSLEARPPEELCLEYIKGKLLIST